MLRTVVFLLLFLLVQISFIFPYILVNLPLKLLGQKKLLKKFSRQVGLFWSGSAIWWAGARITIEGKENIPESDAVCIVCNHQGLFDIPILMFSLKKMIGFIAKKELSKFPIFSDWMKEIGCVFIDRRKKEESIRIVANRVEAIKEGYTMLFFPEGTRSKGKYRIGRFKTGGVKTVIAAGVPILPITIDGSYGCYEKHGRIHKHPVRVVVHPLRETANLNEADRREEINKIQELLASEVRSVPEAS